MLAYLSSVFHDPGDPFLSPSSNLIFPAPLSINFTLTDLLSLCLPSIQQPRTIHRKQQESPWKAWPLGSPLFLRAQKDTRHICFVSFSAGKAKSLLWVCGSKVEGARQPAELRAGVHSSWAQSSSSLSNAAQPQHRRQRIPCFPARWGDDGLSWWTQCVAAQGQHQSRSRNAPQKCTQKCCLPLRPLTEANRVAQPK